MRIFKLIRNIPNLSKISHENEILSPGVGGKGREKGFNCTPNAL